jgi:NAD(P)-dependent dehydrogenase (short-subunit alcohol dehydrogenase family)
MVGGAGYLGTPACEVLARHGARVVIGEPRRDIAASAAESLCKRGLQADAVVIDLGDESSINRAVAEVHHRFGRIDAAVNLATYSTGKAMEQMSLADWEAGLRVSLTGAFLWSRAVGRIMVEQGGGSIVQFGSMYGQVSPDPRIYEAPMTVNPLDYGVAKAGLLQLIRYQAVAWGPKKVRVNAIVPGPFPHPTRINDEGFIRRLSSKTPLNRVGSAGEIAGAVVYLASDASSYTTGTQLVIDGGWTAW